MYCISSSTAEEGPSQDRLSQEVQNSTERVIYGKGKRPLSATERTDDLQIKRRWLEHHDAAVLQRQVWWHLGQLFGFRTQIESHGLKWGDVSVVEDPTTGNERLVLQAECSSKSLRAFQPEAQAGTDTYQCPVSIYKEFESHRPKEMNKPKSPFYLAVKRRRKPSNTVWYMKLPQGVNKIGKQTNVDTKQQTLDNFLTKE